MKKTFTLVASAFCLLTMLISCSKQVEKAAPVASNGPAQLMLTTVVSGQTYSFAPSSASSLTVLKQPLHADLSAVTNNGEGGQISYDYKPAAGFVGTDEVSLMQVVKGYTENSAGGCGNHGSGSSETATSTNVTIRITVTQ